ncbi:hypothetical protein [Nonomuraea fuscirosea]|uniref:hypothetical protein n=1 Tax=Nonomuraea fuscirosea TaxID=1291556 RepID=UPI00340C845B
MTLTGTCVLAARHANDSLEALASATYLSTAALGLLLRYLKRPPLPGTSRGEIAAAYGLTIGQLRAGNAELAEAGLLLQARRCVGRGQWQHLIVVVDTPGRLPAVREVWVLLDATLAAERAHICVDDAHVPTCDDFEEQEDGTPAPNGPIEPVNSFSSDELTHDPARAGAVVSTVAGLRRLAQLPPLAAPTYERTDLWLTPAQVLALIDRYPAREGEVALGLLARAGLPWYLAPRVMGLLVFGYDRGQLTRTLHGVHEAVCPPAVARWRLDQLLLAEPPEHVAWRASSTGAPQQLPPSDPEAVTARGVALARARLRARGLPA